MSKVDLMKALDSSSVHTLYDTLEDKLKQHSLVNLHTVNGECVKIKGDKYIFVKDITPDYITIQFDSHVSDYMFTAIEKIEYF